MDDVYKRLDEMEAADESSCHERIALQAQADILSARLSEFDRVYKNIVRRNAHHRLPQSRKEYFAGHSERQLTGQVRPPLHLLYNTLICSRLLPKKQKCILKVKKTQTRHLCLYQAC